MGLAFRPITRDDASWETRCYLCVKLPSIEDGDAVIVEREDGTKGITLTYSIDPDAVWGDGTPITTEDVLFTPRGRQPSQERCRLGRALQAHRSDRDP